MQRVILLGASNLTFGFPIVLEQLRAGLEGPVDVLAALGYGRSYGMWSRVLHRELPGIAGCELWEACSQAHEGARATSALVTDIGNDLLYGASVPQIAGWVESCLERLAEQHADIVMTTLPMASAERLSRWRYRVVRTALFPGRHILLPDLLEQAWKLNERLRHFGRQFRVCLVEPPREWYGFDPIHIRRAHRAAAWRQILSHWPNLREPAARVRPSWQNRLQWWRCRPARRRVFGHLRTVRQPVLRRKDITLSLY